MDKEECWVPEGENGNKPSYPEKLPPAAKTPEKRTICEDVFKPGFIANIFNTWNKRYSEDPNGFSESLNEDGSPSENYGELCENYFKKLYNELS